MNPILVSGLINVEVTVQVEGFPIAYTPVRYQFFGVNSAVSGVGYNVAKALTTLGDAVRFVSITGQDLAGGQVLAALDGAGISRDFVAAGVRQTPQSVILYGQDGRRQINVDLKDLQEQVYPPERFAAALAGCDLAILGNINFSRPFLAAARAAGTRIATDVHAIADLDDDYNRDFMAHADILFMSHERLPVAPEEWAAAVLARYGPAVVVVGLGAAGALLAVRGDGFQGRFAAVPTRPVANTIGAGDALFSAFVHFYHRTADPYQALRRALVFASYKIGESGAASGFLTAPQLDVLYAEVSPAQVDPTT
jgi:ribokinase